MTSRQPKSSALVIARMRIPIGHHRLCVFSRLGISSALIMLVEDWLQCRSPRQDDFAKRPILNQMAQGFLCLAERINPLDDRPDEPTDNQRQDALPRR